MIEIKNRNLFGLAVKNALLGIENARINTYQSIRLLNAISKATLQIENNGEFMYYKEESGEMLIWSQKSNEIYTAGKVCQCSAFKFSQVCFHRVVARLWKNYLELLKSADAPVGKSLHERTAEQNAAPYLKSSNNRPVERVGSIRI